MAARSRSTQIIAANLGNFNQIWTANSNTITAATRSSSLISRRLATSAYDKNVDDQVRPSAVPDDVIQPESEKYWAPHPQTGVFGPVTDHQAVAGGGSSLPKSAEESVLEEKAWFRPTSLQDLEKPHHN
ncbi:hypothetical protein K2173_026511 [Erythroxylum novogranatense]|uniref:Late embryogenesis abundant protein n=1 Tax=Erythroxylum novogranatense TaxID=1862640 RepID=A0AAV8TZ51_9ROSI|nr:hypothetical protein K2173_026511 [Erythroxylum novogranatense]